MSKQIRILIADDQQLVRYGLRKLIEAEPDLAVVGEAGTGAAALAQAYLHTPDILLLDLMMPDGDGLAVIAELVRFRPQTRILVLTGITDDETILKTLQAGATGFFPKTVTPQDLIQAIRAAAGDGLPLHPKAASVVVRHLFQPPAKPPRHPKLTAREREILWLLANGQSNREIARALVISQYTVRSHVCSLLKKLQLRNRTQAALYVLKHGVATH
jgi:DNA-binding NarL/FixJ family response regulator